MTQVHTAITATTACAVIEYTVVSFTHEWKIVPLTNYDGVVDIYDSDGEEHHADEGAHWGIKAALEYISMISLQRNAEKGKHPTFREEQEIMPPMGD